MDSVQHPLLPLANLITLKDQIEVLAHFKTKITLNKIMVGFKIQIKVHFQNQIKVDWEINKVVIHKVKATFNHKTRATFTSKINPISSSKIMVILNKMVNSKTIEEDIKTITKVFKGKEEKHATLV